MNELADMSIMDWSGFSDLLLHFVLNVAVVLVIIRGFYYPKSRRRDYFFTFMMISVSVFLMIFLLGNVKLKVGFALGLFAIFSIIRYRTESMPVREMTYLFVIIVISVINALAEDSSYLVLVCTDIFFILAFWFCESNRWLKHISCKIVRYDRIELIVPEREAELLADLKRRTGLDITKVEVGHIDFLNDTAILKVYYDPHGNEINTVDTLTHIPKEGE